MSLEERINTEKSISFQVKNKTNPWKGVRGIAQLGEFLPRIHEIVSNLSYYINKE